MKLNLISYIMALPVIIAGCTQSDILYEAEYNVTLNPENTYIAVTTAMGPPPPPISFIPPDFSALLRSSKLI